MSDSQRLFLQVSSQQKERIQELFEEEGWDYIEVIVNTDVLTDAEAAQALAEAEAPGFQIEPVEGENRCDQCLSYPCVTDERFRQLWWETDNYEPHNRNSGLRKVAYKKFWTMLLHRDLWRNAEYLERKDAALAQDANRNNYIWAGQHKRDLMPNCVVDLVRSWYPNTKDVPYMGHKWI
jgi:hypothetical protein